MPDEAERRADNRPKADKAQELAGILGIDLPHAFVPAAPLEIMRRGRTRSCDEFGTLFK
jgi:hypothetical protein